MRDTLAIPAVLLGWLHVAAGAVVPVPRAPVNDSLPPTPISGPYGYGGGLSSLGWAQGTNEHAYTAGEYRPSSPFASPDAGDYEERLRDPSAQPALLTPRDNPAVRCVYAYRPVLGSNHTDPLGEVWQGGGNVVAADTHQGGIGDCGMGSAVNALVSGPWGGYLKRVFVPTFDRPEAGDRTISVAFRRDGKEQTTLIDDQLPILQNNNTRCAKYIGYQAVRDAGAPAADGSYPQTNIFFMPLFEKAFAKFLDNNLDWSNNQRAQGYAGLGGIDADYVLAAVTGGTGKTVVRTQPGVDPGLWAATLECMRGAAPCVFGTGSARGLGEKDVNGTVTLTFNRPDTTNATEHVSGYLTYDSNDFTISITDLEQADAAGSPTVVTLVKSHAYAFDPARSSSTADKDAVLRLINPWGHNPEQVVNGTGHGPSTPAELTVSLANLVQAIHTVYTVESMDAL